MTTESKRLYYFAKSDAIVDIEERKQIAVWQTNNTIALLKELTINC